MTGWAEAQAAAERGEFLPAYLVSGKEPYLLFRSRQKLLHAFQKCGATIWKFDATSTADDVLGELSSLSLFAEQRLVIWEDCPVFRQGSSASDREKLLTWLENAGDGSASLLLCTEKANRNMRLYKRIAARGAAIEHAALSRYNLGDPARDGAYGIVLNHLKEHDHSIQSGAFRELRLRCETDLWSVVSELDRLMAYVGSRREIQRQDVELLVSYSKSDVLFDLIDAVGRRDLPGAMELLGQLLRSGSSPLGVLAMLSRNVSQVRAAKDAVGAGTRWLPGKDYRFFQRETAPSLGQAAPGSDLRKLHPFAAFKAFQRSERFTLQELDALLERLADLDLAVKSTAAEPARGLQMLLLAQLLKPARGNP